MDIRVEAMLVCGSVNLGLSGPEDLLGVRDTYWIEEAPTESRPQPLSNAHLFMAIVGVRKQVELRLVIVAHALDDLPPKVIGEMPIEITDELSPLVRHRPHVNLTGYPIPAPGDFRLRLWYGDRLLGETGFTVKVRTRDGEATA